MLTRMHARQFLRLRVIAGGIAGLAGAALAIATITALYPNPLFRRMTPVRQQDWGFLLATSALMGVLGATYMIPAASASCEKRVAGGGLLSLLAIGCPVCNKVVVLLLGGSGALTYWAPIQPLVALAGLMLLVWAVRQRLAALPAEAAPATSSSSGPA